MAANYVTKSFNTSVTQPTGTLQLSQRFERVLNNVRNMIQTEGPVYHTWISFQVGGYGDPVIFNTDTTNPQQNCIAQLSINKTGAGTANDFTLNIIYDIFNYGQESQQSQIEKLDEYLAAALSKNMENLDALKGFLQYGYVSTSSDADLTSPYYSFLLTDAISKVDVSSGITQYTFKGVTAMSTDCDFQANIEEYSTNWKLLDVVEWTVFRYYGDNEHKPANTTGDCIENEYKYRIDIPQELYDANTNLTVGFVNNETPLEATTANPIQYIAELLQKFPLTYDEINSGEWDNYDELKYNARPRYDWYITDADGVKTWHLVHYNPKSSDTTDTNNTNYLLQEPITWGLQEKNIVLDWNPSVDTKLYLIQRASYIRAQQQLQDGGIDLNNIDNSTYKSAIKEAVETNTVRTEQSIVQEYYDAELTLVGIPADPPIGLRMKILPRILESISRTQGTYMVKGAEDTIATNGTYKTVLTLFRVDDTKGSYASLKTQIQEQQSQQQQISSTTNNSSNTQTESSASYNNDGSGGKFTDNGGSGGGGRRWPEVDKVGENNWIL